MLGFLYFIQHIFEGRILSELLQVELLSMVQQWVHNIAVALIAPERKVSKAEHNRVISILSIVGNHVTIHVAAAANCRTSRLKTHPVLTTVLAVGAGIVNMHGFERLLWCNVLGNAVRTVTFRLHCMETTSVYLVCFKHLCVFWLIFIVIICIKQDRRFALL